MPGLCHSNELISRDEGLHTEFAVLMYHYIQNKLDPSIIQSIIREAVEIEKEFILESLPCKLLGMNQDMMSQYIEYISDRLLKMLGVSPIYNSTNPFEWMEGIAIQGKTNFFEKRVGEYSNKANPDIKDNNIEFNDDF
jgi:ribonucleoside-diphosphate reductase subunit M2